MHLHLEPVSAIGASEIEFGRSEVPEWKNCIISYIDMSGVKSLLERSSKEAIQLLRRMHVEVQSAAQGMTAHEEICFWNDSVLLVGVVDGPPEQYRRIMTEVNIIKNAIDSVKPGYAICVKGQAFPAPVKRSRVEANGTNLIYVHASSLALSNCFRIEKVASGKRWRRDWYIDDRIIKHIDARPPDWVDEVELWPRNRKCRLHMYTGSFQSANGAIPLLESKAA